MRKRLRVLAAAGVLWALGTAEAVAQFSGTQNNAFYNVAVAASRNETAEAEELVIQGGQDINGWEASGGRTALDYAASYNNTDLVQFLLSHGAHVDARDSFGNTALHWAAQHGSIESIKLLIAAKAQVDAQNRQGLTPLMMAADQTQLAAVRLLISEGADPKKRDFTGRDAFGWAAGKSAVVAALGAPPQDRAAR